MITFIRLLQASFLFITLSGHAGEQASDEHLLKTRASLASAERIHVVEGLPHQLFENKLLAKEKLRKDTTDIGGHAFYTPKTLTLKTTTKSFRDLLVSSDLIKPYSGPKRCGGFHPDFAVTWSDEDEDYAALICFGCHELKFIGPDTNLHYDIQGEAYKKLKTLLAPYQIKRPQKLENNTQ